MKINRDLEIKFRKFMSDYRAKFSLIALTAAFLLTLPAEFV